MLAIFPCENPSSASRPATASLIAGRKESTIISQGGYILSKVTCEVIYKRGAIRSHVERSVRDCEAHGREGTRRGRNHDSPRFRALCYKGLHAPSGRFYYPGFDGANLPDCVQT